MREIGTDFFINLVSNRLKLEWPKISFDMKTGKLSIVNILNL